MEFFTKLIKRNGLGGAILLYGLLCVAPYVLAIAAILLTMAKVLFGEFEQTLFLKLPDWMPIAILELGADHVPGWTGLVALFVGAFALGCIGGMFESQVNKEFAERERMAKTPETTVAEVVEVAEEVAEAEKPTPTDDLEERESVANIPETTAEVAKDEKPTPTESAPTIDKKNKCMRSSCERTRHPDPDKPLCPECWDRWTKKEPWRCVKCNNRSSAPLCPSCHPKWLEWLKS